jgi:DTW domain-containing protein YfiP
MSNTGKIIVATLPNSALFIAGDPGEDARLHAELARQPGRCAVLFPSKTSVSVRAPVPLHAVARAAPPPPPPPPLLG